VCIGHRGRAELEIVVRGEAGHASEPSRARNALDLVGGALAAVRDLDADQPVDPILGAATAVATMIEVQPETRNVIPDQAVIAVDWRVLPDDGPEDLVRRLTRAVGQRIAEIPIGFRVDVRIASVNQRTYTGFERSREMFSPGFLMDPEHPAIVAAAAAVGTRESSNSPARVRPWRFATDGGWTCGVHGIPTIGFAPGEEHFAHTNRDVEALQHASS
jgi:acetylornithine deacetylase/succinyl-diaminopimelate desuccinylase-like protein